MPDQLTPGLKFRPWQQPWQVCFVPCWQHWTMRPWRMKPPFQHVFLLRPWQTPDIDTSRWLYLEWSFMGVVSVALDAQRCAPLHDKVMREGAMIQYGGHGWFPPPHLGNGLWPMTCVTFVRQVLGLPFRARVWTPRALWEELIEQGGTITIKPPGDRP